MLDTFVLEPSADIHLILTPPAYKSLQLKVMGCERSGSTNIRDITGECYYWIRDENVATLSHNGGLLTACSEGITFIEVEKDNLHLAARVWVHQGIADCVLGNSADDQGIIGLVNVDCDNFQPTIYGLFDNGDQEDITGHPYLEYNSLTPQICWADPCTGRVTGKSPGIGTIEIRDKINNWLVGDRPWLIIVRPRLSSPRPIVERVPGGFSGNGSEKRNLLFIAEGFTEDQGEDFRKLVHDIDHAMRSDDRHQPFRLLSRDYNSWLAFDPSPQAGVTFGPLPWRAENEYRHFVKEVTVQSPNRLSLFGLIGLVGIPTARQRATGYQMANALAEWPASVANALDVAIFDAWKHRVQTGERFMVRNTVYGLIHGPRLGDRCATPEPQSTTNNWYFEVRGLDYFYRKDPRRMGTATRFARDEPYPNESNTSHWCSEFFTYLGSLKQKHAEVGAPLYDIGQKWIIGGADQGLVIALVNNHVLGGNFHQCPNTLSCVSIGRSQGIPVDTVRDVRGLKDHAPGHVAYFRLPLVTVVTHELCHGLMLGDEYDDEANLGHSSPSSGHVEWLEYAHNLNTSRRIEVHGPKWCRLLRIERSSGILRAAMTAANRVECDLFPGEGGKWQANNDVRLIAKNLNDESDSRFYPDANKHQPVDLRATILEIDRDHATLQTTGNVPAGAVFDRGMICVVKQFEGHDLTIFLPGVIRYMNPNGALLPNGRPRIDRYLTDRGSVGPDRCKQPSHQLPNTPYPIPGVTVERRNRYWLIGLNEGGGTYNCEVFRPAAACRMRFQHWKATGSFRFCGVCQYLIVQEFNPSRHADLDQLYQKNLGKPSP